MDLRVVFLILTWIYCRKFQDFDFDARRESLSDSKIVSYDPDGLSNPEFNAGKHKTTLAFASYLVSITDYASPGDVKKQMNQKFSEKFPGIRLTYSKFNRQ